MWIARMHRSWVLGRLRRIRRRLFGRFAVIPCIHICKIECSAIRVCIVSRTSRQFGTNGLLFRNTRLETLAVFAQSLYLIFASVYVCKEALEHLLLSHGEGHHHHRGDEADLEYVMPSAPV